MCKRPGSIPHNGQEKDKAATAEQNENNNKSISTQAFELYREGESPVEVAIRLNLREAEATRLYREFLKLNRWHKLARIHEELKDDIEHFVKLYRLCQMEGIGPKDVIKLLEIANNKNGRGLKGIENRYENLKEEINFLETRRFGLNKNLRELQNQVKTFGKVLDSFKVNSNEQQRNIIRLHKEKTALEDLVKEFKNNDKEYQKITQTVERKAKDILSDKKGF